MYKFNFWLFLIQFLSHVLQAQQRRRQPAPTSQMATGWSGAGASASRLFSGLLGSPTAPFNDSDYVDSPSTQQTTGQRSTPSAAAGSAEQLHDAGHQHTHTHSARDDVTEHEHDQSWYFYKLVNRYLFESIRLHFFESIRFLLLWKYSFAFFWKYSFAITLKVFVCIFLKVFVCYNFESIRLMCYYGHSELWTMNCYELLETVIWTAVRDPKGECVVVCVCVMNIVNKEL